jgi:hypothetical protein
LVFTVDTKNPKGSPNVRERIKATSSPRSRPLNHWVKAKPG